jgi:hypothetical protein
MISSVFFTLSALCFAAMLSPRKSPMPVPRQVYTYYVGDTGPMPTWKRKVVPAARVAARVV